MELCLLSLQRKAQRPPEVCPQTLTLGLFALGESAFHCVRESERRKGRKAAETPLPPGSPHPGVQAREAGRPHPRDVGSDCAIMGVLGRLPPKAFPILSADWVKSPHAGTWTGPHREVEAPQSPVLHPISPASPLHWSTYQRPSRGGEKAESELGGRCVLAQAARPAPGRRTDRSCEVGPPGPRAH